VIREDPALSALPISEARRLFSPEGAYLNTASYGLPPRPAWEAMHAALDEWRHGRTGFDTWDRSVGMARASFARMHGVAPDDVAVGPQVSPFVGLVALSLPRGARVVCAEEDFTSVLFPLLAQEVRGVTVDLVPLDALAEAIDSATALVAVSAVQPSDGRVTDLDAIAAAAAHHGAQTLVDGTQACGWLPLDAGRFDFLVCAGYKWLLGPRGTAFLAIRPEAAERLQPYLAGWYAAEEPMATQYGGPLRLAGDARRFDISPAWHSWVGHAPAMTLLEGVGIEAVHAHDLALADRFRAGLGLPPGDSAIVSAALDAGAGDRLRDAGVTAAVRDGRMRFSFHLYTTEADVDRALDAL
jgi:selenocysteine lyase/cysteine desulfurase